MFSILVSSDDTSWETDQLMMWAWSERFNTCSGNEGSAISLGNPDTLKALENTTALLMYEDLPSSPRASIVRIGLLKDISSSGHRVTFRFIEQGRLPRATVNEFTLRLGMTRFDHNHTHWAIKDFDIPSELLRRVTRTPEKYDIVLSFAGENRAYAKAVAEILKANGVHVFYDEDEEASLLGKDLLEHFDWVYRIGSQYCVMFLSEAYARKMWTRHERRSALARALEQQTEYVFLARFDDTPVDGIRPTLHWSDLRRKTAAEYAELILKRLGKPKA